MTRTRHFFLRGRHIGSAACPDRTLGQLYLCPVCGEVWARVAVDPPFYALDSEAWTWEKRYCNRHPPDILHKVPGSLFSEWAPATTFENLPPAVLKWEFEVHMRAWEYNERKANDHETTTTD